MKTVSRFFHQLCAVYTVSVLLLLLCNAALRESLSQTTVNSAAFLWLFVFAAVFAIANLQLCSPWCPYALRVLLHCGITVGAAFCLLYLPMNGQATSSGKLLMFCVMLVLYWVVMTLYLTIFRHFFARRAPDAQAATSEKTVANAKGQGRQNEKKAEPYHNLFGGNSER